MIAFGVMSENQVELPKGFTNPDEIRVIPDPVYYDSLNVQGKKIIIFSTSFINKPFQKIKLFFTQNHILQIQQQFTEASVSLA